MTTNIKNIITDTIKEIILNSTSSQNINKLIIKHEKKVHFVPFRYRIINGVLQGLNIKFGNFIESLISKIIELDPNVELLSDSGKKTRLFLTAETDALIDEYITSRQLPNSADDCTQEFNALLKKIIDTENLANGTKRQGITKDIDCLFRANTGKIVYTEIKYNDDHDTGKFADINRKFIKTWAGLAVKLNVKNYQDLMPILYYFNPTKRYGPIHVPSQNIMRGTQLFDEFLNTKYSMLDFHLRSISNDPEILKIFDDFYHEVRNGKIERSS